MGFEWSIQLENQDSSGVLPLIRQCFADDDGAVQVDSTGISVLSDDTKWSSLLEISLVTPMQLYCVFYSSFAKAAELMADIEHSLDAAGVSCVIEEL